MLLPIKELSVKIYDYNGEYKGVSNLVVISKNKIRNGKQDIEASNLGVFHFKATKYKDGYKLSKNPIIFK